ncbi:hypothetical protein D3X11_04930 [Streptococcus sp. X16XC17]|uniref:transglutaminase domain-containing protein n=1 Tax=unclassified Streptococcus TaxID=2608887 RepID=UPI00066FE881|nr:MULTISPECIES: transglutaminase domain-containing protein [unclassified Streptococcus]TCD46715.1 hypothetical protein D3X11_04930 [Streptococcus sp. X16XC17]
MSLKEFLSREVDFKHPVKYKNVDFTGRQDDLEDLVVKKVYEGAETTGVFYGTKDQADLVYQHMINGSFQGAYFRHAEIKVQPPVYLENGKYQLEIKFGYREELDYIRQGEKKVTEFYEKYKDIAKTDLEREKLIHDWLLLNASARNVAPTEEHYPWVYNTNKHVRIHSPASIFIDGEGVCLTYTTAFARMAERFGIDVRVVHGYSAMTSSAKATSIDLAKQKFKNIDTSTYSEANLNHAWNLVKIEDKWYHVNTYHTDNMLKNWQQENPYMYFLKSDSVFEENKIALKPNRNYYILKA